MHCQNNIRTVLSLYSFLLKSDTVSPLLCDKWKYYPGHKPGCAVFALLAHRRFHPLHMKVENRIMRCNQSCQNVPYTVHVQAHLALLKSNTCPVAVAYRREGGVWGVQTPPRNSEDTGGVLDRMSKKNRRLDFLFLFTVFSYGCNLLNKGFF